MTAFINYQQEQIKQIMAIPAKASQYFQNILEITTKVNEEILSVKKDPQEQIQHYVQLATSFYNPEQPHQKRLQEVLKSIQQDMQEMQQKQQQLAEELLQKLASGQEFLPSFLQAGATTGAKAVENMQKLGQQTLESYKAQADKISQAMQEVQKTSAETLANTQKAATDSAQQGQKAVQEAIQYGQKAAAEALQQAQKAFTNIQNQYSQVLQSNTTGTQTHGSSTPAQQQYVAQNNNSQQQQQMSGVTPGGLAQPGSQEPANKQK